MHEKRRQSYKHNRPTIGVLAGWRVYTGTLDTFLGPVYQGTRAAARDLDCNLLLSCSVDLGIGQESPRPAWAVPSPDVDFIPVGPWNVDGLLIVGRFTSEHTASYLQRLVAEGYPIVFVGAGENGPTVMADNEGGIHQAMAHLVAHGHRRIAFIGGYQRDTDGDSARRINAYHAAVAEHGLESDPRLIAYGSHSTSGGRRAMEEILASHVPFTALVASNDLSAIGALQALNKAGLRAPQDVAVIGFDDRLEATAHVPPLTTVRYPAFEEGYQAVALVLEYIAGRAQGFKTVQVPTQLIVRESCGCLIGVSPPSAAVEATRVLSGEAVIARVAQTMTATMSIHMQRLNAGEVSGLCRQLVEAFAANLQQPDSLALHLTLRQVLQKVIALGGNLHAWQAAISLLRENIPPFVETASTPNAPQLAQDILDHARLVIDEVAHEQHTRHLLRQIGIAEQIGRMTARFFAAQDEAEIFAVLPETLPAIGIQHALVAFYEAEDDDPAAWSVVQAPPVAVQAQRRFPSRQFPPVGLYPEDQPFSLALLPLRIQGGAAGFVAFDSGNLEPCADIVRQLAAALRGVGLYRQAVEAQRLAEERRQMAEDASRLKSRFLSMVSHELRTPLNLISGLSDLLLHESEYATGDGSSSREDLERIYVNAQHLDGLIRDVLDLTRIEIGQLQLSCAPLDMVEVLEPVIVIARQLAQDKGLAWQADIPAVLPRVWGDRLRLRQVALNLVNNAIKFTAQGEVTLRVSTGDDTLTVTVRDTGLGILPEEQAVIFDEFRQSERTTARGYGGLGLGLAICKLLVEMHQGRIGVCSSGEEGSGSEFYFTLPVMKDTRQLAAPCDVAPAQQVWLFVQDIAQGQRLREHLAHRDTETVIRVLGADDDWRAALAEGTPDAVVLDQAVTAARGWEILRMVKENPQTHTIPVLFCALDREDDTGAFVDVDFLTKPVRKAQLTEVLVNQGLLDRPTDAASAGIILVVEDDADILDMHTRLVQTQLPHYNVLPARNGVEALRLMRQERPDLVLLDLMMPELDGFGVLEAMRGDPATRNVPVVILTAQVLTEEDMARLNRGTVSILGKGLFSAEETLQHVETVLARRRKAVSEVQRLVHKAMAFIHTRYMDTLTRGEIAAHVGLSERHLTRCFQQEVGVTPMTYLNRYRIKQAKVLLESSDMGITEIALAVGFSSGGYFTRVFHQEMGISPRAYQCAPSANGKLSEKCKKPSEK
ncbi:MAG TPA: substrate-binding domain-containing protein [Anaerolineae bacterium]|nr:substrate-binding domain-containing protein [Anaerolineae bacterium]HQI84838.1 substrate-binding domain-containing protein [Anaerolineae bacterium]